MADGLVQKNGEGEVKEKSSNADILIDGFMTLVRILILDAVRLELWRYKPKLRRFSHRSRSYVELLALCILLVNTTWVMPYGKSNKDESRAIAIGRCRGVSSLLRSSCWQIKLEP